MIAVVDYATGNLRSVADALRRAGAEFTLTADPALLRGADKVILPGVGEARRPCRSSASGDSTR